MVTPIEKLIAYDTDYHNRERDRMNKRDLWNTSNMWSIFNIENCIFLVRPFVVTFCFPYIHKLLFPDYSANIIDFDCIEVSNVVIEHRELQSILLYKNVMKINKYNGEILEISDKQTINNILRKFNIFK